jgi:phytoene dehydrogenase-like protein
MAPYNLNGDKEKWLRMKFKEECAEKQLSVLQKYAPNMTRDKVLWWNMTTPADIENKFVNMVQGSIKQGAYDSLQMGYNRPNEECPFGAGYGTANVVAEDIGAEKWWPVPEHVAAARAKGMPL